MTLTYWVADRLNESRSYSIRRRTRKEVREELAARKAANYFGPPRKVTVVYNNAFHLVQLILGEGGIE